MTPRTFLFIFHPDSRRLGSNNFRNSTYKKKTVDSIRVSKLSFRFLWLWLWGHICSDTVFHISNKDFSENEIEMLEKVQNLHQKSGILKNLNWDSSLMSFAGVWESNGIIGISFHQIFRGFFSSSASFLENND